MRTLFLLGILAALAVIATKKPDQTALEAATELGSTLKGMVSEAGQLAPDKWTEKPIESASKEPVKTETFEFKTPRDEPSAKPDKAEVPTNPDDQENSEVSPIGEAVWVPPRPKHSPSPEKLNPKSDTYDLFDKKDKKPLSKVPVELGERGPVPTSEGSPSAEPRKFLPTPKDDNENIIDAYTRALKLLKEIK